MDPTSSTETVDNLQKSAFKPFPRSLLTTVSAKSITYNSFQVLCMPYSLYALIYPKLPHSVPYNFPNDSPLFFIIPTYSVFCKR